MYAGLAYRRAALDAVGQLLRELLLWSVGQHSRDAVSPLCFTCFNYYYYYRQVLAATRTRAYHACTWHVRVYAQHTGNIRTERRAGVAWGEVRPPDRIARHL